MAGDQHHFGRIARLEVVDELDALPVGELQIREQHVGLQARHVDARCTQRIGLRDTEALAFGELGQPLQRLRVVVYEQQMRHVIVSGVVRARYGPQNAYQWRAHAGSIT